MASTRIYVVIPPPGSEQPVRLVKAGSQAQAIRHCVSGYTAKVAEQDELVTHLGQGARVETAGDEPS